MLSSAASVCEGQSPPANDPVPLQRIAIPPSRLPAELERARPGILVQMPRNDFEALVQRAASAGATPYGPARLTKAKYAAELSGNSLVHGTGQWTIHWPGRSLTVLSVPSFNLAVSKMRWAGGGEDAVLGNLDGKNLGLLVSKPGDFVFDWSLQGTALPGGIHFDLQVPPCPVTLLELTVPADHQVLIPKKNAALLSGPEAVPQSSKRLWRLECSGRSELEFQVRPPAEAQQIAPLILSRLQAKQQITPERLAADFEFQVEVLHTSIHELVFDCDPALQPYDVSVRNADLKDWEFKEAPPPGEVSGKEKETAQNSAILVVHLREPFQGSLQGLKIRCLAHRQANKLWTSPALRLRQARSRGEALKVFIHPDVHMEAWDAAGFRLLSSTTDSDGSQVLSLVDPAVGLPPSHRPVGQFKSKGVELHTRQWSWWQIGPEESVLSADISYEAVRGSLYQLAVKLPVPNNLWRVEEVHIDPKDALRSWVSAGPLLLVDLQRGLNPRNPVKLSLRLVWCGKAATPESRTVAIPLLEPLDSSLRQGTVAVSVDPQLQVALEQVSAPGAAPEKEGPWAAVGTLPAHALPPRFFFRYRGQAVTGQLRIDPQKARVRVVAGADRQDVEVAPAAKSRPITLPADAWCDQAQLVTYAQTGDHLLHHFRFHAGNWRKRDLAVLLPPGTKKILAAKVDGHWLEHLDQEEIENGRQVNLPGAMDREGHAFELYYLSQATWSGWPAGADVEVVAPRLPVPSVTFRRSWRLAPGLVPLHQEHLQAQSDAVGFAQDFRALWNLGHSLLAEVFSLLGEDSFTSQRQALLDAESELRRQWTKDTTLGEAAALFLTTGDGWTAWEPRPGQEEPAEMRVIQSASLPSLGVLLGALALGLAWSVGRLFSSAWCFRLWVIWQVGLSLALVWLPAALRPVLWWPLVAAAVWFCCWLVRFRMNAFPGPSHPRKSTDLAKVLIGSSSVWLLLMPGPWATQGRSQGPEPYTVLLVESEPGKQLALIGQDLVKKLRELENRGSLPRGAVLLGARYQGKMKGALAEFTVRFDIHSFSDKAKLLLPLSGVELQEGALLDGAPAFPTASTGLLPGYVLNVEGQGAHHAVLSFTVRLAPVGDYQELRFSGPRLCTNLFEWTMAGPADGLQLVNHLGEENVYQIAPNTYELKADVGREAALHLRWRLNAPPARSSAVEVREAYFWDLRPGAAALSAALVFAPVKGTMDHLALALPEEMEIRSLDALLGNPAGSEHRALLKKWYVTGQGTERQLHIDLAGPVANPVLLVLNLLPRIHLAEGTVLLKLPLPLLAKQTESFVAYRLEGLDAVDKHQNLGVTSIAPDIFGKVWAGSGQKDPGAASRAYSFRRTTGNAALALTLTVPRPRAQGEVSWNIHPDSADFTATLRLTGAGEDISLVEVNLPPGVTLADVRAPGLHHWGRHDTSVQIWLQQPRKEAVLELAGWAPLAQKATRSEVGRFLLPLFGVRNVRLDSFKVKVLPSLGVAVEAERLRNLSKGTEPNTFAMENPAYEGTFQVRLLPVAAEGPMLTPAEVPEARSRRADPPVKILLAQEQAFLADGRHWAHQTDFLVAAHGATEVQLVLPAGARLLALTLDDQSVTARAAGPETSRGPLEGLPGPRTLRAHWRFLPEAEPFERPNIGGAHLAGAQAPPLQGRLLIPTGYRVTFLPDEFQSNDLDMNEAAPPLPMPKQGTPVFWQLPDARRVVGITLADNTPPNTDRSWSDFLLLGAALLLMLSYVPRGLGYLAGLWPELCILLALVGMHACGLSLIGMSLAALGVVGRLFWGARSVRRFVSLRQATNAAPPLSGNHPAAS